MRPSMVLKVNILFYGSIFDTMLYLFLSVIPKKTRFPNEIFKGLHVLIAVFFACFLAASELLLAA